MNFKKREEFREYIDAIYKYLMGGSFVLGILNVFEPRVVSALWISFTVGYILEKIFLSEAVFGNYCDKHP
jgi:hypothetical protein